MESSLGLYAGYSRIKTLKGTICLRFLLATLICAVRFAPRRMGVWPLVGVKLMLEPLAGLKLRRIMSLIIMGCFPTRVET